jgi:hypothetical protein
MNESFTVERGHTTSVGYVVGQKFGQTVHVVVVLEVFQ